MRGMLPFGLDFYNRIDHGRKLEDIEEKLWSFGGKSVALRYLGSAQGGEDVNGLLEDLQEAVDDYMVCP